MFFYVFVIMLMLGYWDVKFVWKVRKCNIGINLENILELFREVNEVIYYIFKEREIYVYVLIWDMF